MILLMPQATAIFLAALLGSAAFPQKPPIAVVTVPGVEAYARTVEGLRERIPDLVLLDARDERRLREAFGTQTPPLAVAVGSEGAAALERTTSPNTPLLRSVVFEKDLAPAGGQARPWITLTVELPPALLLSELTKAFPGKVRLGVIRGPMQSNSWAVALDAAARQHGFALRVIRCESAREVVESFLQFKSAVDMVWCPPNGQLYNSATLRPLLIASFTNRLPIIGFSEQFVEAGALFGAGPDFLEVGRQTAALALRMAHKETVPVINEARKFRFAYNERAARLVGLKAVLDEGGAGGIVIIR